MRRLTALAGTLFIASIANSGALDSEEFQNNWPQWRGPEMNGVAANSNPPTEWSEEKNVKWKVDLPGYGHASPIVWEDKIFVLSAIDTEGADRTAEPEEEEAEEPGDRRRRRNVNPDGIYEFAVLALNRNDGAVAWKKTACQLLPHEGTHRDGSWASSSPVTDGEHVFAFFGSRGVYCYDLEGNEVWQKDLGDMTIKMGFGEGSSPALYGDTLIVNWDHEEDSFIVALDKNTGDEKWRVPRDERTSWSTPLIVDLNGKPQVIVSATSRIRSYALSDGALLWECGGMTGNVIPAPVTKDGIAYIMSGFRGAALKAIDLAKASGDVTDGEAIVWERDKDTPYVPSPLLYDNHLYFLKTNDGILSCLDADTGEPRFAAERLSDVRGVYSSPVGAGGVVYIVGREGTALVLKKGEFEVVATNNLEDQFSASPAIVGDEIILRGHESLYCIAED
jgi:outer membrane protein assembly factor BamB